LQSVTQQLCDAHLMDSDQGGVGPASALTLPLSSSTVTPLEQPLNPLSLNAHSQALQLHHSPNMVSSLSSSLPSGAPLSSFPPNAANQSSPNHFTAGMCIPGSTAAGFLPTPDAGQQQLSSSLQNG